MTAQRDAHTRLEYAFVRLATVISRTGDPNHPCYEFPYDWHFAGLPTTVTEAPVLFAIRCRDLEEEALRLCALIEREFALEPKPEWPFE